MAWGESGRSNLKPQKLLNLLTHLVITDEDKRLIVGLKEGEKATWST